MSGQVRTRAATHSLQWTLDMEMGADLKCTLLSVDGRAGSCALYAHHTRTHLCASIHTLEEIGDNTALGACEMRSTTKRACVCVLKTYHNSSP